MDKVNELLRQAWQEAYDNGVVLRQASFNTAETYGGNDILVDVEFDARLLEQKQ